MKNLRKIALMLFCCAVFGLGGIFSESVHFLTASTNKNEEMTLPELFKRANTAVVAISTETTQRNFFGQVVTLPAAGSGFIVSADGYIVTNDHVIENANRISVMLYDGSIYPARVVGRYRVGDLAVLKIEADNLSFLTFGDSCEILVGEQVAAIGNPLGELSNSMTVGHISGLDREITISGVTLTMIQTDASVNSGNSGGPLLNLQGEVIGVVTARAGGSSRGLTVEGLGFAIPSNIAAQTVSLLIKNSPTFQENHPPTPNTTPGTTPPLNNGNQATNPFTGAPLRPFDPKDFEDAIIKRW
jgi:serine protease Do